MTVGHVAKELLRHIWFAIQKRAKLSAVVDITKPKPSPLLQGGLEIFIKMTVYRNNKNYIQEKVSKINIKEKVSKINFQDMTKEIRESVKATEAEETDSGDEMNDDDDDVVLL